MEPETPITTAEMVSFLTEVIRDPSARMRDRVMACRALLEWSGRRRGK